LRRLYEVFYRDHQEYQAADAAATNFRPVFEKTGRRLDEAGRRQCAG